MHRRIGRGPACVVYAGRPDHHAFRGSYGGYAFPLYDRRPGGDGYNLDLRLVQRIGAALDIEVSPEQVFDVVVALLSAPSYTRLFAADLEDAFPHVPIPASAALFERATRVGACIRQLQTFETQPEQDFRMARLEGGHGDQLLSIGTPTGAFADEGDGFGAITLNDHLRLEHVPCRVWAFRVSGYQVVYRWLKARDDYSLDEVIDEATGETLQRQLFDLVARLAAYIASCDDAEPILEAAIGDTLDLVLAPGATSNEGALL